MKKRLSAVNDPKFLRLLPGIPIALALSVMGAGVLAFMIGKEVLPEESIGPGCTLISIAACAVGTLIACLVNKGRFLAVGAVTVIGYLLTALCLNMIFFQGQFHAVGKTVVIILFGGGIGVLPGIIRNLSGGKPKKFKSFR